MFLPESTVGAETPPEVWNVVFEGSTDAEIVVSGGC